MTVPFKHITVIGCGLMGGSLLMALREVYPDVWLQAVDPDEATLQYAVKNRLVEQVSRTLPSEFSPDHLIVLASHLTINRENLKALAPNIEALTDVWVSDLGSCKRGIVADAERLLPSGRFVGGHPLAGREISGIENATGLLFAGKPFVFCPTSTGPDVEPLLSRLRQLVVDLRAVPKTMTADDHDSAMAYVSHFPQLYAVLLGNLLAKHKPGQLLGLYGGGLDDQMRLLASPYPMWRDIFAENADNLEDVLKSFTGLLHESSGQLGQPGMAMKFERANDIYKEFQAFRSQSARQGLKTG